MWISTVRIGNPAFHLCSGHVDHTAWETTGLIRDRARGWRGEEVELMADGEGLKKGPKKGLKNAVMSGARDRGETEHSK